MSFTRRVAPAATAPTAHWVAGPPLSDPIFVALVSEDELHRRHCQWTPRHAHAGLAE